MSIFICDVESDGVIPNKYSMVCFGVVKLDRQLKTTFYGQTKPISKKWNPEALKVSGFTREQHEKFDDPYDVMVKFKNWLNVTNTNGRPIFVSDNNGYDWSFMNYYLHMYLGENPFGFSSRRIGDIYSGLTKDMYQSSMWKKFRKTSHTHNPVDDAKGNAEALIYMVDNMGLKLKLE